MCGNFPNIKVTEGNAFSLVLPLKKRTYESCKPIDEDIDIMSLEDVVFKFGGVEYATTKEEAGVRVLLPATLARGVYDIVLTAMYQGSEIRAAYESAVSIVAWNSQSDAQQFIPGSPIVMDAAYLIGGAMTDAELEALKEEYREKNAQLAQAIADAEAAKREWEEKAADLDGVAKQGTNPNATNTAILEAVQQGGGTDIAKESTSQQILTKIGIPASGQGADLFAAMRDIALSATTLQELADAWSAMVTNRESLDGLTFLPTDVIDGVFKIVFYGYKHIVEIDDDTLQEIVGGSYAAEPTMPNGLHYFDNLWTELKKVTLRSLTRIVGRVIFNNVPNLEEIILPALVSLNSYNQTFNGTAALKKVYLPNCTSLTAAGTIFAGANLIDLTLGPVPTSFSLSGWSPTNALDANSQTLLTPEDIAEGFTSNLEKLLYNIREHIAANLPVAPNTITFSAEVKAAILADQPTADAFTNKNWTIA